MFLVRIFDTEEKPPVTHKLPTTEAAATVVKLPNPLQLFQCDNIHNLTFSPDKQYILGISDRFMKVFDVKADRYCQLDNEGSDVRYIMVAKFIENGKYLTGAWNGKLTWWNLEEFPEEKESLDIELPIFDLEILPDHTIMLGDRVGNLVRCTKEGIIYSKNLHKDAITKVKYLRPGVIATASWDCIIKIINEDGVVKGELTEHTDWVVDLSVFPDQLRLGSASYDDYAKIWDTEKMVCLQTLVGHPNSLKTIYCGWEGYVITGDCNSTGTIKVWKYNQEKNSFQFKGEKVFKREIKCATVSADQTQLVLGLGTLYGDQNILIYTKDELTI